MFDVLIRLVENSLVMSVAILVLLGLGRITRNKVSARVRYAGWIVVAVGLLLPVRPVIWTVPLPDGVGAVVARFDAEVWVSGEPVVFEAYNAGSESLISNSLLNGYFCYESITLFPPLGVHETGFLYAQPHETAPVLTLFHPRCACASCASYTMAKGFTVIVGHGCVVPFVVLYRKTHAGYEKTAALGRGD